MTGRHDAPLDRLLAVEQGKARKLQILFGGWWRHYAVPYEFPATLYVERPDCPYCGGPLGGLAAITCVAPDVPSAHLDHMDPLSRGGEDSIRNALYVCGDCNLAKGRRRFADWLSKLEADRQSRVRALYEEKHGHAVETFEPGPAQARLMLPRLELALDEAVLARLFPKPIVTRPPRRRV